MCLFCQIIKGEIPSLKVYENDYVYAFLDIHPCTLGHTLIIPKKHFDNVYDLEEPYASEIIKAAIYIANLQKEKLGATSVNLINNSGKLALQTVFHFHLHVLPRYENDNINFIQKTIPTDMEKFEEIRKKLIS